MTIVAGLRDAWAIAATKPVGSGLRATEFSGGGSRIFATVTDDGWRGLLISVGPRERIATTVATVKKASSAIGAELFAFFDKGKEARGLHLWCTRLDLLEAFVGFCEPFIARVQGGQSVESAFSICFEEFRKLISAPIEEAASQATIGLLGELLVLSELVAVDTKAIDYWFYPVRERHDFRNGTAALEVKTSLRSDTGAPIVSISAIDQLDPPDGGSLYLHWLRLERDPAGSASVSRLFEKIAGYVTTAEAIELRKRVFGGADPKAIHTQSFSLQQRRSYRVGSGFPKLAGSRLITGAPDPGVRRVTYELDLANAAAFLCPPEQANSSLVAGGVAE